MNGGFIQSKGKVLFLATVPSMIVVFNLRNIRMLQEMGYEVHAACNFKDLSAWTEEKIQEYRHILTDMSVVMHQIDFPRKPWHPLLVCRSYRQIRDLLKKEHYTMMHNQSCVSGIVGRVACHGLNLKIIHTEHGFYYFKGGPLINWLFFPFDKICSCWTDSIIVINHEDYNFAKHYMSAKNYVYIPGVGINTKFFSNTIVDREKMRNQLRIPANAFVVLSVGELNINKNHSVILKAISELNHDDIYYVINGEGSERDNLIKLSDKLGMGKRFILTGNVKNVNEYTKMADVFAFPSKREGLGLAAIEAMAAGLPIITSNKNGINDYSIDGVTGFKCEPDDIDDFAKAILKLYNSNELRERMGVHNCYYSFKFDISKVDEIMLKTYNELLNEI